MPFHYQILISQAEVYINKATYDPTEYLQQIKAS